jgi:deoxycytidylate deaminase
MIATEMPETPTAKQASQRFANTSLRIAQAVFDGTNSTEDEGRDVDKTQEQAPSKQDPPLPFVTDPELIFGLVGPIGVDLDLITNALSKALEGVEYAATTLKITQLMREIKVSQRLDRAEDIGHIASIRQRINYANEVRESLKRNDVLAILAISAIRAFRIERGSSEEKPLKKQAYILSQFKRPEEVKLLRSVYGRQFIQISVYAPQAYRIHNITQKELGTKRGLIKRVSAELAAESLVKQDEIEGDKGAGQNVRDAFPLGDVFIESKDPDFCSETLNRFVRALFGDNHATPEHDEYGMYMAKSASLRSSALTRQVGSAIFRESGEIVSMGCNEVPKAGGGTYWSGDGGDARDFVDGHDPNYIKRIELLADLINRLLIGEHLSKELSSHGNAEDISELLLNDLSADGVKQSRIMDLIEFGRDIHAEMSAISDAARKGLSVKGATLYCTTFPCHICAKHIVAAGIKRVVYIEPYPKSYAQELHSDSIEVDGEKIGARVAFQRFIGISPYRYRDLFEKGSRRYSTGIAQRWNTGTMRPMIDVMYPSYFQAETYVVKLLENRLLEVQDKEAIEVDLRSS